MDQQELEQKFRALEDEVRELRRAVVVIILYGQSQVYIPPAEQAKLKAVYERGEKDG